MCSCSISICFSVRYSGRDDHEQFSKSDRFLTTYDVETLSSTLPTLSDIVAPKITYRGTSNTITPATKSTTPILDTTGDVVGRIEENTTEVNKSQPEEHNPVDDVKSYLEKAGL